MEQIADSIIFPPRRENGEPSSVWEANIAVQINNDADNGKVSVTASMNYYTTGTGLEGVYRAQVYIDVDGTQVSVQNQTFGGYGPGNWRWLVSETVSCSLSNHAYKDSCKITVGGWVIADEGVIAGASISGRKDYPIESGSPSEIKTNSPSVQMGKKLIIDLIQTGTGYTHTLFYNFGSSGDVEIGKDIGSSYSWDVPDLANLCTNALSGNCTLKADSYRNGKPIGTTTTIVQLTVQDPTTATVEGSEVTMGSKSTVNCRLNSKHFTVKLEFQFYGGKEAIGEGKADTMEWTPGYDLAKLIPNLPYGTGRLVCTTMNGTAVVGTRESTVRANVPDNDVTRPKFAASGLVLTPVSNLDEKFAGMYIRGKTGIKALMSATSEYSTIAKYELTVGGLKQEGNPAVIELLVNDGTVEVTAKVTDARGYSRSVKTSVYVYSYRNPKVVPYSGYTEVICQRAASTGELTSNGTFLAIRAGKSFSSIAVNGQEKNSCALRYRWRRNGTAEFSQWLDLLPSGSASNSISTLIGNIVSDLNASYTVELTATDELNGEHTLMFQIMTKAISFVLYDGEDGAGFGKYPEAPHVVDIASHMTLLVRGKLVVSTADWEDLGLADGVRESVYSYGRKEYSSCYYLVSNGNHVHVAFNCGLTYNGTSVIVNKNPIPEEYRPAQSVFSICAMNGRCIAMVSTNPDGFVRIEWVQNLAEAGNTGTQEVIWIDGYLDHWT